MSSSQHDDTLAKALGGVRDLYTGSLAEHGLSSKAVGWKDAALHDLRFDRLARVIAPGDAAFTVADWGCGYGAMFGFLDRRFGPRFTSYVGYDISEEMLGAARQACPPPRAAFVAGSEVTAEADYVFVSGTFNVRFEADDAAWGAYVRERLEGLYARSRRGLAFNLLTSYVDWREPHLYYADPSEYFDFCKRQLSRFVTLVHDYSLYEWTILVHREQP